MGRPLRPLISRKKTLEVALKIVDKEGLDALSIRRLGRELNVQGISLYHHFKNKDEILHGVCALALSEVRTPNSADLPWQEWLLHNAVAYLHALQGHPNLIPILMLRQPLRIGLDELNATAGLLVVQGVPAGAVIPLLETLEEIALGSAAYDSASATDRSPPEWKSAFPVLYHLSKQSALTRDEVFALVARAAIDAIVATVQKNEGTQNPAQDKPGETVPLLPRVRARSRNRTPQIG